MTLKKVLSALLSLMFSFVFCLSSGAVSAYARVSDGYYSAGLVQIPVSAKSAILIEGESRDVLFEKSADLRLPMASTTKIMSVLTALKHCKDIKKTVRVSPLAVGVEGSSIYLFAGEELTLEDLLYAMLLGSANDASTAVAIEIGGSVEGFADMMNDLALEMGLKNTHFVNPHGLDDPDHYTTARELATIASYALKNEAFRKIASTYKKVIPLNQSQGARVLINHNRLLKSYDGAIGVKTGYTKRSGRSLVSAAERNGLTLIAVTINDPDDWRDHTSMLDYGFSVYEHTVLYEKDGFCYTWHVVGGKSSFVTLKNSKPLEYTRKKSDSVVTEVVELYPFAYAPIANGKEVGRIVLISNGKEIASSPLYCSFGVERNK